MRESCSDRTLFALAYVLFLAVYWGAGLLLVAVDLASPRWWPLRRFQPHRAVTPTMVVSIVRRVALAQATIYPACFLAAWPAVKWRVSFSPELPSRWDVVVALTVYAALTEILFYYGHRLLHWPPLYRRVHKIHHEHTAPIGLGALYFHWVEHLQTVFDAITPALMVGSHILLLYLWFFIATLSIVLHHSGYDWPFDSVPGFGSMAYQHDNHHKHFNKNFGVVGVMDYLHGTGMPNGGIPKQE
mmetsp:Transcript_6733/g.13838  ORF Transcript_6733/g.13838 Transcript_6733/m.13838 type:complete len:243 (+) Transcript_6733:1-729(+)